jgi:hypothetical protein
MEMRLAVPFDRHHALIIAKVAAKPVFPIGAFAHKKNGWNDELQTWKEKGQ